MVAPLQLLHFMLAKQVFDIFIFFSEVAPLIMFSYYHYQTIIICLNQIDAPHAAFGRILGKRNKSYKDKCLIVSTVILEGYLSI